MRTKTKRKRGNLNLLIRVILLAALTLGAIPKSEVNAAAKKPLVISFVHRNNIGSTSNMDLDAISSATMYSGSTGEKQSTIEVIRDTIRTQKKAKSFAVKVKKPYSRDYEATINRADKEIDKNTKVKLKKSRIPNLKKYDTIYLCTPVWHGTLPQPVRMLLKSNNFKGKTIYVFGANLGSGYGDMISAIKELCPKAKVVKAKTFQGDASNKSVRKSVKNWLKKH